LAALDVEGDEVEDWNRVWVLEVLAARAAVLGKADRVKDLAGIISAVLSQSVERNEGLDEAV